VRDSERPLRHSHAGAWKPKIAHFFKNYNDLKLGKWEIIEGCFSLNHAKEDILTSIERYKVYEDKQVF
jgi:inorganic pyrophosphatase